MIVGKPGLDSTLLAAIRNDVANNRDTTATRAHGLTTYFKTHDPPNKDIELARAIGDFFELVTRPRPEQNVRKIIGAFIGEGMKVGIDGYCSPRHQTHVNPAFLS